jgi:hypothetical protein
MSATNEKKTRPSTTSSSTISATPALSSSSSSWNAATTGPSCPPSRLTEISSRPYTAVTAPTSVESHVQEAAHARPSSAYTGYANSTRNATMSFSNPLQPPEYFTRPDSATSTVLECAPGPASSVYTQFDRPTSTVELHIADRPETALLFNRPDTAEAPLPPRRELPFARSSIPRSAGSDTVRPSSRPSTGIMGPPPLPARVASLRPASSRATTLDMELPPLPKPTILDSAQRQPSWMQQPPRTPNEDQTASCSAQPNAYDDQEKRPLSNSSSSSSTLSCKRSSTNISSPTQPLSSLSNVAQNRRRTESQSPLRTPPTATSRHQAALAGAGGAPEVAANDDLAAYAMQSDEGRRAALNEFIFRQLESDNFLTLLEDMETCWARSGLGMG